MSTATDLLLSENARSLSHVWGAYQALYTVAIIALGLAVLLCLIRAVKGPRITDRIIAVNMIGSIIVIVIALLTFMMDEGYLIDIAIIYTLLSFLAVVLLTKIYMGIWRKKFAEEEEADKHE